MNFDNSNIELVKIEELEYKYLMKYWYFLKFAEDEMVRRLQSMDEIRNDWEGRYGKQGNTSKFDVGCERIDFYSPNLPVYYTKNNGDKKLTLTYFVCLLNNGITLKSELISIMCMPNGKLEKVYHSRPLKAGKNPGKTRFNFSKIPSFELLEGNKKRVRIIHKNPNMSSWLKDKLKFYLEYFDPLIGE